MTPRKQQTFSPPGAFAVPGGPHSVALALARGTDTLPLHTKCIRWSIEQIINESTEHRLAVFSLWQGAQSGCRGSAAFSERSFSTRRPKSTFQLTYRHQNADCKTKREEVEDDGGKMTKRARERGKSKVSQVWLCQLWKPTCLQLFIWLDIINYL